jgi:hypothetical protein
MNRRAFLAGLSGSLLAAPLAAASEPHGAPLPLGGMKDTRARSYTEMLR